jgi:ABC-type polysaccharide/polyol phosphate transport system ATPase subunit
MSAIELDNVTLQYPVYTRRALSLRNQIVRLGTGGILESDAGKITIITALKGVSMRLSSGDRVGLVGYNGAGKSTMLKVMAGIYEPMVGLVRVEGSVTTFFQLSAGMDSELSGYENICRLGMQRGLSKQEALELIGPIEEFSELGDYLALPIRTYSAGMHARLAFAIAVSQVPDILLIDEVFGAGDASFQKKANEKLEEVLHGARILVFASHSDGLVKRLCSKAALLHHGELVAFGNTDDVLERYAELQRTA